jgi:hypothetical protein
MSKGFLAATGGFTFGYSVWFFMVSVHEVKWKTSTGIARSLKNDFMMSGFRRAKVKI